MKLHAGHAVIIVMVIFILIMTQFMVRAYYNQEALVADDYYAKELRYQEQIEKHHNSAGLAEPVHFAVHPGRLVLTFPGSVQHGPITGELFLMRPNDADGDLRVSVTVDPQGQYTLDTEPLMKGAYSVHLEWQAGGTDYLSETAIHIP